MIECTTPTIFKVFDGIKLVFGGSRYMDADLEELISDCVEENARDVFFLLFL